MKRFLYLLIITCFFIGNEALSQNFPEQKPKIYKVAVFAPLYLDSVFSYSGLRSEKSIPKFIMPALDFVQGVQIAFDTMGLYNEHVEAFIYDTKSYTQPLSWLIKNKLLDSIDLMIGAVKDVDFKQLADFSLQKNIPFLSAVYPNDGGITANPFLAIMNSTLKAHCEGIYSYILQNHGTDKIYLCRKPGPQEDKITAYFKTLNEQEGKPLLSISTINFDSSISPSYFKSRLDSVHPAVIIGASLDENFARELANATYAVSKKKYPVTLIGMPNWDGFKTFLKKDVYKDFPIHFTTPFYNSKSGIYNGMLADEYHKRFKAKPGDMAYKGFEAAYFFTKLLLKYPSDFISHINDKTFTVFSEFNFRPVFIKNNTGVPDYFENKHLYVMRILNGEVSREW
jgi:hypothetical protein